MSTLHNSAKSGNGFIRFTIGTLGFNKKKIKSKFGKNIYLHIVSFLKAIGP